MEFQREQEVYNVYMCKVPRNVSMKQMHHMFLFQAFYQSSQAQLKYEFSS